MALIAPKKSLGQNYLIDKNIAKKIVALSDCKPEDIVIEIGPGKGILTEQIINYSQNVICVEIDKTSIELLKFKFPPSDFQNVVFVNQDIRKFDFQEAFSVLDNVESKFLKVIGNIPYNISADILFYLFSNSKILSTAVLTVQKEVAERLISHPNCKEYGILSVATQLKSSAKKMFDIPPRCFRPIPKVTSSVVLLNFLSVIEESKFPNIMKLVKAGFSQRRKLFRNSIKRYIEYECKLNTDNFANAVLERTGINISSIRAENISPNEFIKISNIIDEMINAKKN